MAVNLPVPVLNDPFWRVNLRPEKYEPELIPSLANCYQLIEQTKVSLRGWNYPHLSHRESQRGQGVNWVASWSDFDGHKEYWRLYQSSQFIHLFSVREAAEPGWREKLEAQTKSHSLDVDMPINWSDTPGFISILNFLYTVTEVFEFTTRLCQKEIYRGAITVTIQINGIKGFVLTTDLDRSWHRYCVASEDTLGRSWVLGSDTLVAGSGEHALKAIVWFFERFGWLNPSVEVLREDQRKFLRHQL